MAEVLAKAAFLAGADDGCEVLEAAGLAGMLVLDDGRERRTVGYQAFLSQEVAA
jgi:thiamine biosynthesis lipoprotein ApbE